MTGLQTAMVAQAMVNARNADLQRYARWEYRTADVGWLLASARASRSSRPRRKILSRLLRARTTAASRAKADDSASA